MNMLANLTTSDDIAPETDRVAGRQLLDAGVYAAKIKMAYLQKSSGGALGMTIVFELDGGQELRTTQYLTGGDKKGNLNYYTDKQGNKQYLPGFNLGNSLAMLTTGKELSKLAQEDRLVNIYDFTAKAEKPTSVPVIVDLIGEEINVGVLRVLEDKMGKDDQGGYTVYTGETRESNEVDKFFCAKPKFLNMTTAEIRGKAEKAVYIDTWTKDNAGQVRDKTNKDAAKQGGAAGAPKAGGSAGAAAGGTAKPDESLFD